MKCRLVLALFLLGVVGALTVPAGAQEKLAEPVDSAKVREDLLLREMMLSKQYAEFEQSLLKLVQRLYRGNEADKRRAAGLEKALELSKTQGVVLQFERLVAELKSMSGSITSIDATRIQTEKLAGSLKAILDQCRKDARALGDDQLARLKKALKEIDRLIREEQMAMAITEIGKAGVEETKQVQQKVTADTEKLLKDLRDRPKPVNIKAQEQDPKKDKDPIADIEKNVEDATKRQKQAEDDIGKEDKENAIGNQGGAVDELKKARKRIQDLLDQLRKEELQQLLTALLARCEKMLRMQTAVFNGSEGINKLIDAADDKKPTRDNQQASLKLSDQEKDIILEATQAIEMLEAEGTGVAFPEVFQQLREDMKHVQRRLEITDVGVVTQAIETDIIDTLKEMIAALKRAQDDINNPPTPPTPPPGAPTPPTDQKLLDQIAELKMIRSLQLRVNARTVTYGKMYIPKDGEQATDPAIRRELHNLSERQTRITEIATQISRGDNK